MLSVPLSHEKAWTQRMEVRERRWWTHFRNGQERNFRRQKWQPGVCVKSRGRERQRKRGSGSKTTALTSRGGSYYITEGWVKEHHHAWLPRPNTATEEPLSRSHGDALTVCLSALLFQGGQLCDSRRWHLSSRRPLIGSWQITELPFHLSLSTVTSAAS